MTSRLSCKENVNSPNHHKDDSGVWLFIQYILYKEGKDEKT